ncbi:MAG TPA: Na+/H+ antiporter NhaC family protein [Coleofasciculaceae cyanobacterium]|jgi:NhaC family Na+:H+ antiporter
MSSAIFNMDLLLAVIFSFTAILFSVAQGYFIAYPLLLSLAIFIIVLRRRGFPLKALIAMGFASSRKSFQVIIILLLIGIVTAVWMAAGTVPALVYYGTQFLSPQYFVLSTFILTSFISTLLGTSFGTVSTIGVALMIMARGSDVNPNLVAGAIIGGAYFGDRCSPMSSSANLVASITNTKLYKNIKNMVATAWLPLLVSSLFYLILSISNPVKLTDNTLSAEIPKVFNINLLVLLPALVILSLSLLRVEVKFSLLLSVIAGLILGMFCQGYSLLQFIKFAVFGFSLEATNSLSSIFNGGGLFSMIKVSVIVIISTAFAGIIAETRVLEVVEDFLSRSSSRSGLFLNTIVIGLASAAFGCTQTIAILLTQQLVKEKYEKEQLDKYQLATDLENTVVVLSPLIPWNIAGLVPATILMTNAGFIPYAFYLYLLPILSLIQFKLSDSAKVRVNN